MNAFPLRNGVAASTVVLPTLAKGETAAWTTVSQYLVERFPHVAGREWQTRIAQGDVQYANGQLVAWQDGFAPGARIHYFRSVPHETPVPFDAIMLHQSDHLLVVDKPHFLPVMPSGQYLQETLLVRLRNQLNLPYLTPIHRIDRDTAGLVLFSVNPSTRDAYHALFRNRAVHKTYEAIAVWNPNLSWHVRENLQGTERTLHRASRIVPSTAHFMQMMEAAPASTGELNPINPINPINSINAITDIRVLSVARGLAHLQLQPLTGQRHQLRVHLNALGMPILNDGIYPHLRPEGDFDFNHPLQLLARTLAFVDPITSLPCKFGSQFQLQHQTMETP